MSGTWTQDGFLVSAVIPAYNGLPFVLEAIESALDQSLPPAEILVVDDRSTDGTADAVAQRFGGSNGPTRVRVLSGQFGTAAAARNAGWHSATSPWIAFLDADDLWFKNKLTTAAQALEAFPRTGWFFSDGAFRALDGTLMDSWIALCADMPEPYAGRPISELFEVNFILTSSVVVRRDLLDSLGGFDERLSHAEDLDLWIRLARQAPATGSRQPLVRYQHREGGLSLQVTARLMGDVVLFRRLASDPTLAPTLRRRARHREALAHNKLAVVALREGRGGDARRHLRSAWLFPERALAVAGAWLASLLPASRLEDLRRYRWAKRHLAGPTLRHARVSLRAEPELLIASRRGDTP